MGRMSLCRAEDSILLIVDIQQKLAAAMPEESRLEVFRNAAILAEAARLLAIPRLVTEQYPKGLGPTDPALAPQLAAGVERFEKTVFSCCGAAGFTDRLKALNRRQVVICGMEAHVCVLQTALELAEAGYEVFVAEDAVCSRREANRRNAMERLRQAGVTVTNTESVVFEWLRDSRHEQFKAISRLVR
ncbi:MAG TPA: hydrolase [Bryobacterales bacterium]|nr:hydrolase [Bryobacterales bacterium]